MSGKFKEILSPRNLRAGSPQNEIC